MFREMEMQKPLAIAHRMNGISIVTKKFIRRNCSFKQDREANSYHSMLNRMKGQIQSLPSEIAISVVFAWFGAESCVAGSQRQSCVSALDARRGSATSDRFMISTVSMISRENFLSNPTKWKHRFQTKRHGISLLLRPDYR